MNGDYDGRQYVGIDLHRRRSVIVRMTPEGEQLGWVRIDNDPVALGLELAKAGPDPEVVLEATYGWYWAVDALQTAGAQVHLAHPLGVKGFAYRRVKNDVRDAADLADLLRMGRLPEAYIATPHERELRELVRHRAKLVALRSGLKAQVHGVLAKQGLLPEVSDVFGPTGQAWLRTAPLDLVYRQRIDSLLELIDAYDGEIELFRAMIANRFTRAPRLPGDPADQRGRPDLRRGPRRRDRRRDPVLPAGEVVLLGRADPAASRVRHHACTAARLRNRARSWCAGRRSRPANAPARAANWPPTGPGSSPRGAATSAWSPPPADCSPWSSTACATGRSARWPPGPGERVRTRQGARSCCVMTPTSLSAWSPA